MDHVDRKLSSVTVITYNGRPIYWTSRKRTIPDISTAEAEYVALAAEAQQLQVVQRHP